MKTIVMGVAVLSLCVTTTAIACIGDPNVVNDAQQIQDALDQNQSAVLCQNTTWDVYNTLLFPVSSHDISIYTVDLPSGSARALLRLQNSATATVVAAGGWTTDAYGNIVAPENVQLRNLQIDGGLSRFGARPRDDNSPCPGATVSFGGPATGQIVDSVKVFDARGWSSILFERGASEYSNGCTNGQITNNEIYNAGIAVQNYTADGISLQCANTDVLFNYIQDATDGGIVIFGAPGSTIRYNTIRADNLQAISGIAMTDQYAYLDGNFNGTQVFGNTIVANQFMKFGIAMGRKVASDNNCQDLYNSGASVYSNSLQGTQMGYGFAIDGVLNWEFGYNAGVYNPNTDYSTHTGTGQWSCDGYSLPNSGSYFMHVADSHGAFQPGYVDAVLYGANITP